MRDIITDVQEDEELDIHIDYGVIKGLAHSTRLGRWTENTIGCDNLNKRFSNCRGFLVKIYNKN